MHFLRLPLHVLARLLRETLVRVVENARQVERDAREHTLAVQVDVFRLEVRHLDEKALVELLWNGRNEAHKKRLLFARFDEALQTTEQHKLNFSSNPRQLEEVTSRLKVTWCGIMIGIPGCGLIAMAGSIPRPQKSKPTRPVFIRVISASATWSYSCNRKTTTL